MREPVSFSVTLGPPRYHRAVNNAATERQYVVSSVQTA
jgi:hypothetical protein